MIRYALICDSEHPFEAWFGASADYDDQCARGLIECPACGSTGVRKQIMAPAVAGTKRHAGAPADPGQLQSMAMQVAARVREHVEANFDYVGDAFAREARSIHEGVGEPRPIYGEATAREVRDLKADGVPCAPLPPAPPTPEKLN